MANKTTKPNQTKDHDNNILEPNAYLETEKEHKKWYSGEGMGKMRGKPTMRFKNVKKKPGGTKHSLRKEKGK